ncbi:YetF domain-containing protein [Pseudalkalibacillus sp. R45]|uniref:YetF domain-containing protein n=1 Tax=Pseudalkalibacillus sp. R45 TaxID=3457433 RepID=UPI003FCE5472
MTITELFLRLTLSFFVLFVLTRIMGRKEISQLTFHNFISAIAIGTIAGSLAVNSMLSIRNGLLALVGWTVFTLLLSLLDLKSKKARKLLSGDPVVVIKKGKIMENSLRKTQLSIDALNVMLRKKGVFTLSDVDFAVFETDGTLSVMKKGSKQPLTKSDMNMLQPSRSSSVGTEVVSEGKINESNLSKLHLDKTWLGQKLRESGVQEISEVFYAEVQQDETLYIDKYDDVIQ